MINENEILVPVHFGVRRSDFAEWTCWAVYDRKEAEQWLAENYYSSLDDKDAAENLSGWGEFSKGPGRAFGMCPIMKVSRTRVLVRQFRGLDV